MFYTALVIFFVIAALTMFSFVIINQQSAGIVERFGRFVRIARPGINFLIPLMENIRGSVSLRVSQLEVVVETKTKDNVFVRVVTSVQYRILSDKIYDAFYTLDEPEKQIQSFVFDVVRAKVPAIFLDDLFSKKDEIANSVKEELHEVMNGFGYDIIKALVTDIDPDARVKEAMNEINASQRMRVAATERGEAEKIIKVKQAEAESESKILQGKGTAGQRKAIVDGLKDSLNEFRGVSGIDIQDVMNLVMMTQYFDTIRDLSANSRTNTILLPHSPKSVGELQNHLLNSIMNGMDIHQDDEDTEFKTRH